MNTMEKYEAFREMPQETFDVLKEMYNAGHTGVFEKIATVVKYAIGALLGYIAYEQYDVNMLISILSGISAVCIYFRKKLISIIPSIICAVKMTKNVVSSHEEAEKLLNKFKTIESGLINLHKVNKLDSND